jgi:glycerate kinase
MKLLFASDSFKGSLTSEKTVELLSKAAREVFGECECSGVPVADGGEGTVEAVIAAEQGEYVSVKVHGPLMEETESFYGIFDGDKAVIEMAAASGLPLLHANERNPLVTSTYGTGELILHAIDEGARSITLAIGGSATNDGGMGCMRALGARFLDEHDNELEGVGGDLVRVAHIDLAGMDKRLARTSFVVMCDVDNPLYGPRGAAHIFAPQKGADHPSVHNALLSFEIL